MSIRKRVKYYLDGFVVLSVFFICLPCINIWYKHHAKHKILFYY